jgi:hypothetical protein
MSEREPADPDKLLKPVVLQPGEGGPTRRSTAGVDRTDIPAGAPRRERAVWDVALSAILMFFSLGAYLTGAILALLGTALFRTCTPGGCTGDAVAATAVVLLIVLILGFVATIAAIRLRFRGWWIAAVMLGTILVGWFLSYVLSAFGV